METDLGRILDALPGLVWTAFPDGRAEYVGKGWLDYAGMPFDKAIGAGWLAAVHPEDRQRLLTAWAAIIASGKMGEVEARLRRHDGQYRWFLFRACPMPETSGEAIRWCGMNFDIDDRVRAEAAARELERRHRQVLDGLPAIAALFSPTGKIIFRNRRMLEYLGETGERDETKPSAYNYHPDDRDEVLSDWSASVHAGKPFDREARLRRADGAYRWHRTMVHPLCNAEGEVDLWYGLSIDIEDTKRAEAKLAAEKRLLQLVALDLPLQDVLAALCRRVEELAPRSYCNILLVDPNGAAFRVGAGPSLPDSFNAALDDSTINQDHHGPAAVAATQKAPADATDSANDPRWKGSAWSALMAEHGLTSCRSIPILSGGKDVLGAFAVYRREPVSVTGDEQELIDRFSQIAGIAIERARAAAALTVGDAELRQAHRHLTEAQRLSRTGSFTADLVADEHTWSEEFYRICEFEPGSAVKTRRLQDIVHPEDAALFSKALATALAGEEPDFLFRIVTARGVLKHLHGIARVTEQRAGRPIFMGAIQDVTETKLAEAALRASERELRLIVDSIPGMVAVFSASGELEAVNSQVLQYFGATLEELKDWAGGGFTHPEDSPREVQVFARSISSGQPFELEIRARRFDGVYRWFQSRGHPLRDASGRIVRWYNLLIDIDERKHAEKALNRARAELTNMSRITTLGALTASIAHEVNQPLAGIITNASTCLRMLGADPPNVEGARTTAQRTIRDGNRASEVIQRLRSLFARKQPKMEPVDLNDAAREVLTLSSGELQQRGVVLHTELADDLGAVSGDRIQLQQVVLNLVLNAADAMSRVNDRPRDLTVATVRETGLVTLSVCDTGVGFAPENRERLFDAFYTTKSEGMGIGLSISRSIVEGHEGRIWATANAGPGATFSFSIPDGDPRASPLHRSDSLTQVIACNSSAVH